MAVEDQLERRLAQLRQEIADIETALKVIRSLGEQKTLTQKSTEIDAPMFAVRRIRQPGQKKIPSRPAGEAFWAQQERAEKLRGEIEELFKRENRPLFSGQVIDLTGVRNQGKQAMDRVYNSLHTLYKQGILTRDEMGSPWRLPDAPAQPAGGSEGPSGQSERAA